jgi:uncharacterized protein (TIGR03000 family)
MLRQIFAWSNLAALTVLGALLVSEPAAAQQGFYQYGRSGAWGPYTNGTYYPGTYSGFDYATPGYYSTPNFDNVQNFSRRRVMTGYQPNYSPWIAQEYGNFGMIGGADGSTVNQPALINITVPTNAQISFEGKETVQKGAFRQFITPALTSGQDFNYTIEVSWSENGTEVSRSRNVTVHAGDIINLSFNSGSTSVNNNNNNNNNVP